MLRKVLAFDAASCGLVFIACVPAGSLVAGRTGLPPVVVAAGGWICLAAGLLFAVLAVSRAPARPLLRLAIAGNALWVAASIAVVVVLGAQMTGPGIALVLAQAAAVAVLTLLEAKGAATLRPQTAVA